MLTIFYPQRKYVYPAIMFMLFFLLMMRYALAADNIPAVSPTKASSDVVNAMDSARRDMDSATNAAVRDTRNAAQSVQNAVTNTNAALRDSSAVNNSVISTQNAIQNAQNRIGNTSTSANMNDPARLDSMENAVKRQENRLRSQYNSQAEYIDGWHRQYGNAYAEDDRFADPNFDWDEYDARTGISNDLRRAQNNRAIVTDTRYNEERANLNQRRISEMNDYRQERQRIENRMSNAARGSNEYTRLQNDLNALDRSNSEREQKLANEFRTMDAKFSTGEWDK